jgi:hypothetical protein
MSREDWAWVSATHEAVRKALAPHKGATLRTRELKDLIRAAHVNDMVHPSDHCSNMNNIGACSCAETDHALVRQVSRGQYIVL